MTVRSALNMDGQVVPSIVQRIARHSGRTPLLSGVVPNIPFVPASDPALVSPNIRLAAYELIDIEFNGLCGADVISEKIYVVDKVMRSGVDAIVGVRHPLRRKLPDQMVVPKHVRVRRLAADGELHGFAAQRRRTYALSA